MRIILAGKHELACKLYDFLRSKNYEFGVITCKSERDGKSEGRQFLKNKLRESNVNPLNSEYSHENVAEVVRSFRPDILISAGFDKIIKEEVINIIPYC